MTIITNDDDDDGYGKSDDDDEYDNDDDDFGKGDDQGCRSWLFSGISLKTFPNKRHTNLDNVIVLQNIHLKDAIFHHKM